MVSRNAFLLSVKRTRHIKLKKIAYFVFVADNNKELRQTDKKLSWPIGACDERKKITYSARTYFFESDIKNKIPLIITLLNKQSADIITIVHEIMHVILFLARSHFSILKKHSTLLEEQLAEIAGAMTQFMIEWKNNGFKTNNEVFSEDEIIKEYLKG